MSKLLHFAVFYLIIGLAFASPFDQILSFFGSHISPHFCHPVSICSNTTIAQSYLNQTLALINTLQANSTYNSTLKLQNANFISYLQNTTNQALLTTNCTIFVANVKAAKLADIAAEHQRQQIANKIQEQFENVLHNATGSNCPNELDCNEER